MKSRLIKSLSSVVLLLIPFSGCISLKPYYAKSQINWEKSSPPDTSKIKYSVYLVGDAGNPASAKQEPILRLLQQQLYAGDSTLVPGDTTNRSKKEDVVIFLGDNIYEFGMPEPDAADRKEKERRITEQLKVVKNFKGKTIVVPGNHDWRKSRPQGLATLNREEEFVENYLDSADVFLPSNGCPGPVEVQLNNDLVVIVLDSEWWLYKHQKPIAPDNGCTAGSRVEIMEQLRDILLRNKGKNILIAQHHPLFSNGKHGGYYTLKDYFFPLTLVRDWAYFPLPVIGSIYPLMRQYGISREDLANKDYQQLKRGLLSILAEEKNVVMATGHEHALQFNKYGDLNHIISGAGSKSNALAKGNEALFTHGTKGFARINYYDNGQSWLEFWEPEDDGEKGKLVYRTPLYAIPPKGRAEIVEEKQINYSDSVKLIAAGPQYSAPQAKQNLFGEHYRAVWATPVKVKYLDLATYAGGLTPLKMGGGKQTTSLQLQGKDGNVYQFRTVSKDPSTLLPEGFLKTFAEDFFQDQISSAHPYGALIVPDMAKAVGIYHTDPILVYMPYSRLLGPYIQEVGGKLGILEARPDEDVSDFNSFGNARNAISTRKLYEELRDDNDNEVDQQMYLKARLFDILIGDWDRHEDQWRWAEFKKKKGKLYRPIPRDRDQAFSKYDGFLPSLITLMVPDIQNFGYEIKDMGKLSIAARNLDRNFLNKLSREQWKSIAEQMQAKLTDQVIENAVRKMPKEVFDKSGEEIIAKLKSRRNQLAEKADEYYQLLSKEVTVMGSDKKEYFNINSTDEKTLVTIYKIDKDEKAENTIFERSFDPKETRTINLVGLDGRDSITVQGKAPHIRIRVLGGDGTDSFSDNSRQVWGKPVKYFDTEEGNTIHKGGNTRLRLSQKPTITEFNERWFNYGKAAPIPSFDYNPDDGIFIGAGYSLTHFGFRKQPFSYNQTFKASFAPKTHAHSFDYTGTFYSLFKENLDFIFDAAYNGPKYTFNYYGQGNSTPNLGDDIDYYRVRSKNLSFSALLQYRVTEAFRLGIGPGYDHYWVEKPSDKFITAPDFSDQEDIKNPSRFGVIRSYANIDFVDNKVSPATGVRWFNQANYFREITGSRLNFLQLKSDIAFYATPNFSFPVTAAIGIGAATNIGDYKFFQANSLGTNTRLRGYRNNRFSGRSYVYNNSELRFKVSNFRNYLFTGNFGLFGFFDAGRVFSDSPEKNNWHTGYGPGIWIDFYNKFLISTGYGISKEGKYFSINSGFAF